MKVVCVSLVGKTHGYLRLLLLCVAMARLVSAAVDETVAAADREVIIKWRVLPARLDAADLLPEFAQEIESVRRALPVVPGAVQGLDRITVVRLCDITQARTLVAALGNDPRIEYAEMRPLRFTDEWSPEPARRRHPEDGVPNDAFYAQQWYLPVIEAESAWNLTRGDPSVIVAVVDIGVDFSHPELTTTRWENAAEVNGFPNMDDDRNGFVDDAYGYDFVGLDGDPTPDPLEPVQSHGTHIAGIVAAVRNNGQGIAGVAPECRIMGVRAGYAFSIPYGYEGIYYACAAGARIINCSWGGDGESAYEHDILDYVLSRGCVVVASAGNGNSTQPRFPASLEGTMGVAATQFGDRAADFTHYGTWVKVSAPGVQILSTIIGPNGSHIYDSWQGTSMAAPVAAGVCALVASYFPTLDGRSVVARVLSTCDPIDQVNPVKGGLLGMGRVNAWRALTDSTAGVRLGEVTYIERAGNGDGRIRGGEQAEIQISIYNETTAFPDLYAEISTADDSVGLISAVTTYDGVPLGGPHWNHSPPLVLEVSPQVNRGHVLPLDIDWRRGNGQLVGRAATTVYLDSTFVTVDNGRLRLGFAENGCLGYYQYPDRRYVGSGFRVSERSNALYHGSFVLAADSIVSDNGFGNDSLSRYDWLPYADSVAHFVESVRADLEATATFADRGGMFQLFARVQSAALAWRALDANEFIVLEYVVTNHSVNEWTRAYAGLFLDLDLGPASSNVAELDLDGGIALVRAVVPGHPLVGIASVTHSWNSFYVVENRRELDSLRWSDARKWEALESGIGTAPFDPKDISLLVAAGPFTIPAHGRDTLAFAFVVGQSLEDLRIQAARARDQYDGRAPENDTNVRTSASPRVYPNPVQFGQSLQIEYSVPDPVTIRFYNVLGQSFGHYAGRTNADGRLIVPPSSLDRASGLLIYQITAGTATHSGKLYVIK